jgi:hypothetical protein
MNTKTNKLWALVLVLGGAALLGNACGGDDTTDNPNNPIIPVNDASVTGGSTNAGGSTGGGGSTSAGGSTNTGGTTTNPDSGSGGAAGDSGTGGTKTCDPTGPSGFYDNSTLPLGPDGGLPPL